MGEKTPPCTQLSYCIKALFYAVFSRNTVFSTYVNIRLYENVGMWGP